MKVNQEQSPKNNDEISLREIILKTQELWDHLISKWLIIVSAGVLGGIIGLTYAWLEKPVYKAELSFTVQDESNGGNLSGALGIASQMGLNLGADNGGGEFSGDNLMALMKSRSIVEIALLTPVTINGRRNTLVEYYIDFNKFRQDWKDNAKLANVHFLPDADRSKFTLTQDSLLGIFYKKLIVDNLTIDKVDKKLSIITLAVKSTDEFFSKRFAEVLATTISDFYVKTRTEKSAKNVSILQRQTDSVRRALNAAISGVATFTDATPNPNPSLQSLHVGSQRKQVDVQAGTAILSELVKNLELAKMNLLQSTPLIQVIDKPIMPLERHKLGRLKGLMIGGVIAVFLTALIILTKEIFRKIMLK